MAGRLESPIRILSLAVFVLLIGALSGCTPPLRVEVTFGSHGNPSTLPHAPAAPSPARPAVGNRAEVSHRVKLAAPAGTDVVRPPATQPPTRIVADGIGLDAPIVTISWDAESGWQTADQAAGFHHGSALPGSRGNTVLSGHHNVYGQVFAGVHELKPGDMVTLYVDEAAYPYRVEDTFIVPERGASEEQRRQNATWIAPTDDERLTLVTCWPAHDNSHRVIVIARPL